MKKTLTTSLLALALTAAPAVLAAAPPPGVGANRAPPRMVQTAPAQVRQMPSVRPLSRTQYEAERRQLVRQIDRQERELSKAGRDIAKAERKRDRRDLLQAQREERRIRVALAELRQDLQRLDRNNPRFARFHVATPMRRG